MVSPWVGFVLALALVFIVSSSLRQLPTFQQGQVTFIRSSFRWIISFLAIWMAIQFIVGLLLGAVLSATVIAQAPPGTDPISMFEQRLSELTVVAQAIGLFAILLATFVSQRYLRRQPLRNLGFTLYRGWLWDVAMALLLGFVGFLLLFAVTSIAGTIKISVGPSFGASAVLGMLATLAVLLMVAFGEELLIRGYILQVAETGWGTIAAAVGSSLFWGILHLGNPGSTTAAAINLTASGMVFAYLYVTTRSLWPAIALHFSWNFSEGIIFGFPVSGLNMAGFNSAQLVGPDVITGGSFGPEAGLIIIPILVLQILLIRWWVNARPALGVSLPGTEQHG